jgi:formylmethanofuran dehydrogenase subunit E
MRTTALIPNRRPRRTEPIRSDLLQDLQVQCSLRQADLDMETFEALLIKAEAAHGHMCAGQILGVRMALLGLKNLGIEDPLGTDRKRLVTFVEIDRCATDAIGMVTGCRLGKRTLKFRDWGKMAATFVDLSTDTGVRVVALENSRELARELHPEIESKSRQQMLAYRELEDEQLFRIERVRVHVDPAELPGYKSERVVCARCGEGINFGRFEEVGGQRLCLSCARPEMRYWNDSGR